MLVQDNLLVTNATASERLNVAVEATAGVGVSRSRFEREWRSCLGLVLCGFALVGNPGVLAVEPERLDPVAYGDENLAELGGEISVLWESRYVLEGRDQLDGQGILGTTLDFSIDRWLGGIWYGTGTGGVFSETNLFLGFEQPIGPVIIGGAVQWLWFEPDGADDFEFSVGLASDLGGGFEVAADVVYSVESEGAFYELHGGYTVPGLPEGLELGFGVVFGVNQGYVSDGHDGANHVLGVLELDYALTDEVTVSGFVSHSWGIDERPGEGLENLFWGGVGVLVKF